MLKRTVFGAAFLMSAAFMPALVYADAAPSIHQVYAAAQAGKLDEAQAMMESVLRDHPESGKAHFIEAEILAQKGQLERARAEFKVAERLAPGLPFANPQSIQNLKMRLSGANGMMRHGQSMQHRSGSSGMSGLWILIGLGILAFLIIRAFSRRRAMYPANPMSGYGPGPVNTGGMGMPSAPGGGGIGSGIMSGLATGAAMGAGLAAGEALAHHFLDGNHPNGNVANDFGAVDGGDMGGADFGVSDASSWDNGSGGWDSGSVGGDDWN